MHCPVQMSRNIDNEWHNWKDSSLKQSAAQACLIEYGQHSGSAAEVSSGDKPSLACLKLAAYLKAQP